MARRKSKFGVTTSSIIGWIVAMLFTGGLVFLLAYYGVVVPKANKILSEEDPKAAASSSAPSFSLSD